MNRDNQQERPHLNKFYSGWLSGVLDSDGCFQIAKQKYRGNRYHYRPQIVFHNTNMVTMKAIEDLLKENKVGHYIQDRFYKLKVSKSKTGIRPYRRITIYGFKRCFNFLTCLKINCIGKRKQQDIMLEYINYRFSLKRGSPVRQLDTEYYLRMKEANTLSKGLVSPETIRQKGSRVISNYKP